MQRLQKIAERPVSSIGVVLVLVLAGVISYGPTMPAQADSGTWVNVVVAASALTDRSIPVPQGRELAQIGAGIPVTYVPARNTVFLALALAWAETLGARHLFLGVNALDYSGYPDCRPAFLEAFEALAAVATGNCIAEAVAPAIGLPSNNHW